MRLQEEVPVAAPTAAVAPRVEQRAATLRGVWDGRCCCRGRRCHGRGRGGQLTARHRQQAGTPSP